jgi:hypothetical protein
MQARLLWRVRELALVPETVIDLPRLFATLNLVNFGEYSPMSSFRHGLPASRFAGCVRRHPCQPGFQHSMLE